MPGRSPHASENIAKAAVIGGAIGGAVDISYAIIANLPKASPQRVLQSVASGVLGRDSFDGGAATAALGLALHFAMNILIALIFIAAARTFAPIRNNLVAAGLIYGAAIYFVMRWVVVPLSRFPGDLRVIHPLEIGFHMVGVGLVVALAARRFGALDLHGAPAIDLSSSNLKGL
jgi:uncharacterized membrane protein YagU involved in acid resistance